MITIQSAESALRNIYLETVINDINTKTNPFLNMIQKNAKTVSGKEARATIRYGNQKSVGTGAEGGDLPYGGGKSAEIISPLKNIYGTLRISDKAVRAAQHNEKEFASLLGGEMENLIKTAQESLGSMVYGNGLKYLGYIESINHTTQNFIVPERFIENFVVGAAFWLMTGNNDKINTNPLTVSAINGNTVTYTGMLATTRCDRLYVYSTEQTDVDLNGIDSIFMPGKVYNLSIADHKQIAPCVVAHNLTNVNPPALDEDAFMNFMDAYEEHCQGMPADILLTHPIVRKAVFENLKSLRTNVADAELSGGFKGFSFNGIPVYADPKCKAGTIYALNSDSWKMHQLCDWTWLSGDDGSILKQIDGKAGYAATLVKYADLICDKPFIQGKVTNYSAKKHTNE